MGVHRTLGTQLYLRYPMCGCGWDSYCRINTAHQRMKGYPVVETIMPGQEGTLHTQRAREWGYAHLQPRDLDDVASDSAVHRDGRAAPSGEHFGDLARFCDQPLPRHGHDRVPWDMAAR
jgi:hypothetical protein